MGFKFDWEHKVSKEFAGLGATTKTLGKRNMPFAIRINDDTGNGIDTLTGLLSSHEIDTKESNPMLLSLFAQQSLCLVKDLSGKGGPCVYTVDPKTDRKRVVEIARCCSMSTRWPFLLIDFGNFALNESLGKKILNGARGHIKAQPYDSYAFAVRRAASSGAMAGRQLTSTERVMDLSPSDAASIYSGQYPTVMLISSGYREHFGRPHVPDREFWKERGGEEWRQALRQARNSVDLGERAVHVWDIRGWKNPKHDMTLREHIGRHRDIMRSVLGIAYAEDAITEAITIGRRSLFAATVATSHLLVRALLHDTVPYRGRPCWLPFKHYGHYGVPCVLIHQVIGVWYSLNCGGRNDCCRGHG